jgi:hypothetical protein
MQFLKSPRQKYWAMPGDSPLETVAGFRTGDKNQKGIQTTTTKTKTTTD